MLKIQQGKKPRHSVVMDRLFSYLDADNTADVIDGDDLAAIGTMVCDEFDLDLRSRSEWEKTAKKAMEAALQISVKKNYPFPGASNIKWPLITVAALQFNARAYPALVDGDKIVKAKVMGNDEGVPLIDPATKQQAFEVEQGPDGQPVQIPQWEQEPGAKQDRADRISEHMSFQLLEEVDEWEEDTDTLLMALPVVGCAFRKAFFGQTEQANRSEMIDAFNLVVNQKVKSLKRAPRISHRFTLYPYEIEERQRSGQYRDVDLGEANAADGDPDAEHTFIEQHRWIDLDGDGKKEPYIVTVHQDTTQVVRIDPNFTSDDIREDAKHTKILRIKKQEYFIKYSFIPDPKGGFYDLGFGHLLDSLGGAIDTTINQMLDAGHLQNAGGGFIGSGVRFKKSLFRMEPGLYRTVNAPGRTLRDAIVNLEHPGPSVVLFQLLGMMIEATKDITATKDILTGDTGGRQQTATTTLALIEQGLKVFTAIYKRIYRSFKKEFKILFRLNSENLPEETYFNLLDEPQAIAREDYDPETFDVVPQADPRMVTDMQRAARAQVLMELREDPFLNPIEIRRRFLVAMNFDDIEGLLVENQGPNPIEEAELAERVAKIEKTDAETDKTKAQTVEIMGDIEDKDERLDFEITKEMERIKEERIRLDQQERALQKRSKAA